MNEFQVEHVATLEDHLHHLLELHRQLHGIVRLRDDFGNLTCGRDSNFIPVHEFSLEDFPGLEQMDEGHRGSQRAENHRFQNIQIVDLMQSRMGFVGLLCDLFECEFSTGRGLLTTRSGITGRGSFCRHRVSFQDEFQVRVSGSGQGPSEIWILQ